MPHTVDGTYLLVVIAAFIVLAGVFKYAAWEEWDDRRRHQRRVHRNMQNIGGSR
jgi:hypothetical protein